MTFGLTDDEKAVQRAILDRFKLRRETTLLEVCHRTASVYGIDRADCVAATSNRSQEIVLTTPHTTSHISWSLNINDDSGMPIDQMVASSIASLRLSTENVHILVDKFWAKPPSD
ncbi:hypothetical protein [Paraburkholderia sp. GAS348]|uniref:hypothetical protein n=1 Tax=Paraburkholderia sp. GAS348 TaxID=3035132 RepID=UPI003D250987